MSEKITGYIDHVVFRNEENGYTVMVLKTSDSEEEVTCVGTFPDITQGVTIEAEGQFSQHHVYGRQFVIHSYAEKAPEDTQAMERYLGSGAIKGVGVALAARIVRYFGEDTLRIVEEEPERLAEVKGISEKKAREIAAQVTEKADMRKAMMFLQKYGISLNLGAKIYQKYGQSVYGVLQENPYRLADDISGVGFKIADAIASRIGIHADSDYRIRSGMMYTLIQASGEGHVYLPKEELFARASQLLRVDVSYMEKHLMDMALDRKLVLKEKDGIVLVYPSQYYHLELNTARMLTELNIRYPQDEQMMERRIAQIEKETGTVLEEMQKKAVIEAAGNGLFVLTGGPGTGKTTTINAIIRFFEGEGATLRLAAPTGRAAKRMTEATGYEAQTIHRLLELNGVPDDDNRESQGIHFDRNAENPLDTDVIIIDEMSMVDLYLMNALLQAMVPGTRLVIVGDANQLPSIGAGNVLKDMIASGQFKVVELNQIFRQEEGSHIVRNAHLIHQGRPVELDNKSRDFFFLQRNNIQDVLGVLVYLVRDKLPGYVHAKPYDIQILTPMRKGELGVERLNQVMQQYLNPPSDEKKEKEIAFGLFREGDKVMQIKNNYQIEWEMRNSKGFTVDKGVGVFNGDMGVITEINDYTEKITVLFDETREVQYPYASLDELELAYAVTIHKSQGSEYPAVVMPILSGPRVLFHRNLLYTGVTRAKNCLTIVGDRNMLFSMIQNVNEQRRYTTLALRLDQIANESEESGPMDDLGI